LGYVPHGAARALASHKTRTIGAVIPTVDNSIFAAGVRGLQDFLSPQGYTVLLASTNYDLEEEYKQVEALVVRGIDGMMLVGTSHAPKTIKLLQDRGIPFVETWSFDEQSPNPTIGFNNKAEIAKMVQHLVELGHETIGMIAGETIDNNRAEARLLGAKETLIKLGIQPLDHLFIECKYDVDLAGEIFRKLWQGTPRPTAIICGIDVIAYGALHEAYKMGISIPDQVSITGFDDLEFSRLVHPPLTTLKVPSYEMGNMAARKLIEAIEHNRPPQSVRIDAKLIIRESTASPRQL
jgi:LacI family transcriptional regulator